MPSVTSLTDLADVEVELVLSRAGALYKRRATEGTGRSRVLSMLFFEPSLRTRVGYFAAAARLGWRTIEVSALRHSPMSAMESLADTIRSVSGYSDVIVMRPGRPLADGGLAGVSSCPVINGGDVGPRAEHPSQALIDVFAMERIVGPIAETRLAIVGDPRMRAVRSLLALLARRPPVSIRFIADPEHLADTGIPVALTSRCESRSWDTIGDVDVVYVAGIPHEALPLERRELLLANGPRVDALPARCVLLSPMPVIDEMDDVARQDSRNRMFEQSDLGLYVRMALLEFAVGTLRDAEFGREC